MKAAPRRRWIASGAAAVAVLASAGAAVVLRRTRRSEAAEASPESTDRAAPAQPGAAVRQAVGAAAAAVRDRTDTIAHRAVDGARHTVARARAASRGGDQSDGHSADGARPSEPEQTPPTG